MRTTEVAIVGGGAVGCAAAYYLASRGVQATVIEREGVASQASGFSAGGLNPLQGAGISGPLGPLASRSFRMHLGIWGELTSHSGLDFHGRLVGQVSVAFDESTLAALNETHDIFEAAAGFSARWLETGELYAIEPRIAPNAIGALYTHGNAALDSFLYTSALIKGAESLGASSHIGAVVGLGTSGGRVTSVLLEDGEIACGTVVLAMGPWSRDAEEWLGVEIPVEPLKGEILRMELPGPVVPYDFVGAGGSITPKPDGLVWCGSTEERRGFDTQPSESARRSILDGAVRLMPAMREARLLRHTACLRPVAPDWLPIIGPLPGWDNVWLATGAAKKGILLSPAMGKAVADLIVDGATDLPVEGFSPLRFAGRMPS